ARSARPGRTGRRDLERGHPVLETLDLVGGELRERERHALAARRRIALELLEEVRPAGITRHDERLVTSAVGSRARDARVEPRRGQIQIESRAFARVTRTGDATRRDEDLFLD